MHYANTQYGFEWGCATISRLFSDDKKGWVTLGIKTPKTKGDYMQIYITRTGKIRVFNCHKELK